MKDNFQKLKRIIEKERKTINEISTLFRELKGLKNSEGENIVSSQITSLKASLKITNWQLENVLAKISLARSLKIKDSPPGKKISKRAIERSTEPVEIELEKIVKKKDFALSDLEKITLKRLKKKEEKKRKKKVRKPSLYLKLSNKIFSHMSVRLGKEPFFSKVKKNITRSNMEILPRTYLSMIFFSTLISFILSIFILLFFLFFNFGVQVPFITRAIEGVVVRLAKVFWIPIVVPLTTFLVLYVYPGLEKKSDEAKLNQELPFATIHMSAISGAMIDPTNIFSILVSTGDYPNVSKQFTRLLNQINLQGYSLVNSLRTTAFNNPSSKLSELLNGLATTITSGGDLSDFFDKRAQSLLLEYRLEKEKYSKTAETFMDIYISVVIAAPMILMLLLIMMQISGLGIGFSAGMISLIMALGVSVINFGFLVFLHLRSSAQGN